MTASDSRTRFANTLKDLASKKALERITTEEIVRAAGLSRQTFYKFFLDKYDLAFWCYRRDVEPVIQDYTDVKISFHEMNMRVLQMLQKEKNFYRSVFEHYEVQNSFFQQYHRIMGLMKVLGLSWERRQSGENELSALAGSERFGASADEMRRRPNVTLSPARR